MVDSTGQSQDSSAMLAASAGVPSDHKDSSANDGVGTIRYAMVLQLRPDCLP